MWSDGPELGPGSYRRGVILYRVRPPEKQPITTEATRWLLPMRAVWVRRDGAIPACAPWPAADAPTATRQRLVAR